MSDYLLGHLALAIVAVFFIKLLFSKKIDWPFVGIWGGYAAIVTYIGVLTHLHAFSKGEDPQFTIYSRLGMSLLLTLVVAGLLAAPAGWGTYCLDEKRQKRKAQKWMDS